MLGFAAVVTAGSLYVTASAAAQQESSGFDLGTAESTPVPDAPDLSTAPVVGLNSPLDKAMILKNSQSHVILDENGGFSGRLSSLSSSNGQPIASANISIRLAQHGAIIGSTTTDAEGRFSFESMPEGVVAIWAEGESALMLFSFVLFGHNTTLPENAALKASELELDMDSVVASGADIAAVKELLSSQITSGDKRFVGEVTEEDQQFPFGGGELAVTLRHRRVSLQNDGTLRGEIGLLDERTGRLREILDLTVHFVRNGVRVASAEVSKSGGFIANGLAPGVHSVVVVGRDGIMVSSVDVVGTTYEGNTVEDAGVGEFTPVSKVANSLYLAGGFSGSPVGSGNGGAFGGGSGGSGNGSGQAGITGPVPGSPYANGGGFPGGTSGGGFGGGGGGFGGGGGLGALLAGGIGAGLGYLAGDRNKKASSPGN